MTKFRRHLSNGPAIQALALFRSHISAWLRRPRATFNLRTNDGAAFYYRGQRALAFERLGTTRAKATRFRQGSGPMPSRADTPSLLECAVEAIDRHLGSRSPELDLQAGVVAALAVPGSDFLPLDEQIAVPSGALNDETYRGKRVDLLIVERATGDLWLVEVKPAEADDLDGPVLTQLRLAAGLPGALSAGTTAFVDEYRRILSQKEAVGATFGLVPPLSGEIRTGCLAIGNGDEARARIACWDDPPNAPSGAVVGVVPADEAPVTSDFISLAEGRKTALAGPRAPYAPRRPRWNDFTAEQDEQQAAWRKVAGGADQLGPYRAEIDDYLGDHRVKRHGHLGHPRSSQAACLQLFAPLLASGPAEAKQAVASVLTEQLDGSGLRVEAIRECHFEAPHTRECRPKDCRCKADMVTLVGERTQVTTSVDTLLFAEGRRGERDVEILIGIEFKYTEPEFGCCGGFVSDGNDRDGQRACLHQSSKRPDLCYLLTKHRRKYLQDASMFARDPLSIPGPCLLLGPVNQLYRSHYTVRALARKLDIPEALFFVVYDGRNPSLFAPARTIPGSSVPPVDPFEEYHRALKPELRGDLGRLTAQGVTAAYRRVLSTPSVWLEALSERYGW